jgi:hypothetical protein
MTGQGPSLSLGITICQYLKTFSLGLSFPRKDLSKSALICAHCLNYLFLTFIREYVTSFLGIGSISIMNWEYWERVLLS